MGALLGICVDLASMLFSLRMIDMCTEPEFAQWVCVEFNSKFLFVAARMLFDIYSFVFSFCFAASPRAGALAASLPLVLPPGAGLVWLALCSGIWCGNVPG